MTEMAISYTQLYSQVADEFNALKNEVRRAAIVRYWNVGKILHHAIGGQRYSTRSKHVIAQLASDFGYKDASDLYKMMQFFECYTVPPKGLLSWTHYTHLVTVHDEVLRHKYEKIAVDEGLIAKDLALRIRAGRAQVRGEADRKECVPLLSFSRGEFFVYSLRVLSSVCGVRSNAKTQNSVLGTPYGFLDLGFGLERKISINSRWQKSRYVVAVRKEFDEYRLRTSNVKIANRYTYVATVVRILDGDTLVVRIDLGFDNWIETTLRLRGIDCPEKSTAAGCRSTEFVKKQLSRCRFIIVKTHKSGKYGRWLADVFYDPAANNPHTVAKSGTYLNQELLDRGYASLYNAKDSFSHR